MIDKLLELTVFVKFAGNVMAVLCVTVGGFSRLIPIQQVKQHSTDILIGGVTGMFFMTYADEIIGLFQ